MPAPLAGVVDVVLDTLTIRGVSLPPAGESDRWRATFPAQFSHAVSNSGSAIPQRNPDTSASFVILAYQGDALHLAMESLWAQQQVDNATPSARTPWPVVGTLAISTDLPNIRGFQAPDCRIEQRSEIVSSRNATVVTWTCRAYNVISLAAGA